jgi:hypothetical protein
MPVVAAALCAVWGIHLSLAQEGAGSSKGGTGMEARPSREQLEAIIRERYPRLLTQKVTGTAVVTLLFRSDGVLAAARLDVVPSSAGTVTASEARFSPFRVPPGALSFLGLAHIDLPLNRVVVIFGERK